MQDSNKIFLILVVRIKVKIRATITNNESAHLATKQQIIIRLKNDFAIVISSLCGQFGSVRVIIVYATNIALIDIWWHIKNAL